MDITDPDAVARFEIPVQPIPAGVAAADNIRLDMLRLDMTDQVVSGNKWFKLVYNLEAAHAGGHRTLLSFGGPWSNHLVALAAVARKAGLAAVGMVRGQHAAINPSPSLRYCAEMGMQLRYLSRHEYALKDDPGFLEHLRREWNDPYIVPQGGANSEGRKGAGLIAAYIPGHYTHVCVAAGTGTTLAGLREHLPVAQQVTGFAPMKQGRYLEAVIGGWLSDRQNRNWSVTDNYHFGGFGKMTVSLQQWMEDFYSQYGIPLDRVYTAKMMFGVLDQVAAGIFPRDAQILCIHTGGLQNYE